MLSILKSQQPLNPNKIGDRCSDLASRLSRDGVYQAGPALKPNVGEGATNPLSWRISPEPFKITASELKAFQELGPRLLSFNLALNKLYTDSIRGSQPAWVHRYLDQGLPEELIAFCRMRRLRQQLPGVIRPDIIPTEEGWTVTELDSIPGGMGLTGSLSKHFAHLGFSPIGGADGMASGFALMIRSAAGLSKPNLAIIISEESRDYRPEMRWMAERLNALGLRSFVVDPREIQFTEEGLKLETGGRSVPIHVVYRFFELFDLKNIPKSELILYSAKKGKVALTPPVKPYLEEKMAFGLFHHPALRSFWTETLGEETDAALLRIFPLTWIMDPQAVPPYAVIPGLRPGNRPISNWKELIPLSQKERRYVIKPSGFSEYAWGSRGVKVGHDLSAKEWGKAVEDSLERFPQSPSILQEFHQGKKVPVGICSHGGSEQKRMEGRVRLSPYYFVSGNQVELGGILATICPLDKKLIHGMSEAVMAPCEVG